ncbi:MAG: hypothetical protein ABI222_13945 [Opitutaceae bacterium]
MSREGPALETLLRRLAETPEDFLAEPRIGRGGSLNVSALVGDLLRSFGHTPDPSIASLFTGAHASQDRNRLMVVSLLCWLLTDTWFRDRSPEPAELMSLLRDEATELAKLTAAKKFVTDPERREELGRVALARLGLRPAGESDAQAQDRLTTISSAERARVVKASSAAMKRAREIRAALVRKAAEESADKYTRE